MSKLVRVGLGPPQPIYLDRGLDTRRAARRQATLRQVAVDALRDRRLAVELDEATLARLAQEPQPATTPVSADLTVLVLAGSAAEIDAGEFRLLVGPNLGAQAAGRSLGRFADLLGTPATAALGAVAAAEREHSPADLHVELVYLPLAGRGANVAIRPSVYDHEVVVGTTARVEPRRAIPLAELLVGVRDGRFYVRWPGAPGDLNVHAGHTLTSRGAPAAFRFLDDVTRGARSADPVPVGVGR